MRGPARRYEAVGFSTIVKVRNAAMAMEARGETVLRLEGGEPFAATPPAAVEALGRAAREGKTRYAPSAGVPELRERLLERVRTRNGLTDPALGALDALFVTNGGTQGLAAAFSATVDPGDDVLLFSPYWTPIADMIALFGGRPVPVPSEAAAGPEALRAALESAATERTRLLYFNSPTNPTGRVYSPDEIRGVAAFARERDLVVVSDEAYEELIYDGTPHLSLGALPGLAERTLSVFTLSKTFSMTGLRVGWLVVPPPFRSAVATAVLYGSNGVATPNQWAGLAALDTPREVLDDWRAGYVKRRDALVSALRESGFSIVPPAGALYAFPELPASLGRDSARAAEDLLARCRIASVPGAAFGREGEGHVRMSFSVPEERIAAAAAALRRL